MKGLKKRRPALAARPADDTVIDEPKFAGAMATMRAFDAEQDAAMRADLFEIVKQVGAIQAIRLQSSFLRAAELRLFAEMRESKKFKHLPLPRPDGSLRPAETIAEFCGLVFGASYQKLAEEQQNLEALGAQAYDAAQGLGLNRKELRLIRALPEPDQARIREAIASEDKTEVAALIEDLAAKVAERDAALAEAKADITAKDELLGTKNKLLDTERSRNVRFAQAPLDERHADLVKQASRTALVVLADMRGAFRQALVALEQSEGEQGDQRLIMAGLLAPLQAELKTLRAEFMLPDLSDVADQKAAEDVMAWAGPLDPTAAAAAEAAFDAAATRRHGADASAEPKARAGRAD